MKLKHIPDFLIIDLECTCWEEGNRNHTTETIEIGAWHQKTVERADDWKLEVVNAWDLYCKPIKNPVLTSFCTRLTGIVQEQVDEGMIFPEAMNILARGMKGVEALFTSWGEFDRNQLQKDCRLHGIDYPMWNHLNLKKLFGYRHAGGEMLGEEQALRRIGLKFEGTRHNGFDDAKNTGRILQWMIGQES